MAIVGWTSAAASFLSVEMFGRWLSIPKGMPMLELLAAVYFAVSDLLPARASFRARGFAQRQSRGPETLLITAGATMRPVLSSLGDFGAASNLLEGVRISGTRDYSRVPEETN